MRKKIIIAIILVIIGICIYKFRFQLFDWNTFATDGWASLERHEFKVLIDKYGKNNINTISIVEKPGDSYFGLGVNFPIANTDNYGISLHLLKNVNAGYLKMFGELVLKETDKNGNVNFKECNPVITVRIPLKELGSIVENGINPKYGNELINMAKRLDWAPIPLNKTWHRIKVEM